MSGLCLKPDRLPRRLGSFCTPGAAWAGCARGGASYRVAALSGPLAYRVGFGCVARYLCNHEPGRCVSCGPDAPLPRRCLWRRVARPLASSSPDIGRTEASKRCWSDAGRDAAKICPPRMQRPRQGGPHYPRTRFTALTCPNSEPGRRIELLSPDFTREAEASFGAAEWLLLRPLSRIFVIRCVPALTPVFHRFAHDRARKMSAGDEAGARAGSVQSCAISARARPHRDIMTS